MPITFIVAPLVLVSLVLVFFLTYNDVIAEKEYIISLNCSELKEYAEQQVIESKKYFGHDVYLSYAEELYYLTILKITSNIHKFRHKNLAFAI